MSSAKVVAGFIRLALGLALIPAVFAGGSGLKVAVVVNRLSANSVALGNAYCQRRLVPPQNLIRIAWAGGRVQWTRAEYSSVLLGPLTAELTARGLVGQIDFVVLSMDIPYRIYEGADVNSTTSALFYGFKTNDVHDTSPCRLAPVSESGYYGSELALQPRPAVANAPTYLAMMLTGNSLAQAEGVLERGVASDGTFPSLPVLLEKTSDVLRNVRFYEFDNAIFDARLNGLRPVVRTNSNVTLTLTNLAGLDTGLEKVSLGTNVFAAAAMADSLTSYGGFIFDSTSQTTLLEFLRAGAVGSYGTVVEPCNYLEKFPDPIAYFYQARGFTLAECYYQSLANPYQGLLVGEPLAAPFAQPGQGAWVPAIDPNPAARRRSSGTALMGPPPEPPVLSGTTNLAVAFTAADANHPLQQVDLFVDGLFAMTITNLPPAEGNLLRVRLNGTVFDCPVPAGATLPTLATNLADLINAQTNTTKITAHPIGDRLELDSLDPATPGADLSVTATQLNGSAADLTTFVRVASPQFLDSTALPWRSYEVRGTAGADSYLTFTITKTNGEEVVVGVTNQTPALTTVQLTQQLINRINATPALQGTDGVTAEDAYATGTTDLQFNLYARSPGLPAAQVQVRFKSARGLIISGGDSPRLDENASDLYPRNHLYLTAGVTNLEAIFEFDTTQYADGYHELTAVASEGSSVRTPTRVSQVVRVQNTSLAATIEFGLGGPVVAAEATLPFLVTANRSEITQVDLYGTGGRLAGMFGQASAAFSIPGADLGPGVHPFYAVVLADDGTRYRTETILLELVAQEPPFQVTVAGEPLALSWPATAGRVYEVLSGDAPDQIVQVEDRLTATMPGPMTWRVLDPPGTPRFYRVRAPGVSP